MKKILNTFSFHLMPFKPPMTCMPTILSLIFFMVFFPLYIQAFGLWQCASMLLPELNPMCWDVCGFAIGAEALYLDRRDHSENIDFTSQGVEGSIALHSKMLDPEWVWGYSVFANVNLRGFKSIEMVWMPEMSWKDSKSAEDDLYQLFSVYSNFGISPFDGSNDIDEALEHAVSLESSLETVEVNVKKLWGVFRGCLLYGYRYQSLDEELKYEAIGEGDARYQSETSAKNSMHGLQMGFQCCVPFTSCFSIECFGKGAYYANNTERAFKAKAYSLFDSTAEKTSSTCSSWGIDTGVKCIYEWSRAAEVYIGYRYFNFNHVALALENFNANEPPFSENEAKHVANDGFISYQGVSIGINLIW